MPPSRRPLDPRARYAWSAARAQYRDRKTGRWVSRAEVRNAIDRALDRAAARTQTLGEQLRRREITLAEWQTGMRQVVKDTQLYSAAAARGGWAELTPQETGRVGQRVREQYHFLQRFALQIERGEQPMDGRFMLRGKMYAHAGRPTFHLTERRLMLLRGFDQEENVLAPADHCGGCLRETERGLVPIGQLVPIGSRECKVNCKCRVRYVNSSTGAVAA